MNEQVRKMAAYMLRQMSDEVRNEVYRHLQSEHVKEDVLQFMQDGGISLSMEGVEAVVHAYVYDCRYDCNVSYWENLQSLIKEIHMNELTGNATGRILKEHQQLFLEGNLCVWVDGQRELDALAAVVAHAGIELQTVTPYNFSEHYITFRPQTRTFVSNKLPDIRFEYEILKFDKLDSPSVAGAKKCLENLKGEYDLTDVELTYDDAFDVMMIIHEGGRDIGCNFEAAVRQVLQNIEKCLEDGLTEEAEQERDA